MKCFRGFDILKFMGLFGFRIWYEFLLFSSFELYDICYKSKFLLLLVFILKECFLVNVLVVKNIRLDVIWIDFNFLISFL